MTIFRADSVGITREPNRKKKRSVSFKYIIRKDPTLKELQEKKYPFPDLDLPRMVDDLLEKGVFNFQSRRGSKRLEGLVTPNTAVIIRW